MKKAVKVILLVLGLLVLAAAVALTTLSLKAKLNVPAFVSTLTEDKSEDNKAVTVYRDIVYKTVDDKELKLDIYLPTSAIFTKSPTIFVYHGGSWESGDKELDQDDFLLSILEYGIAIISVDYRLTDANTTYPAHLDDAADAIRYVELHAAEYGLDPDRFCTLGASAGGQMSLMLALDGNDYGGDEYKDVSFSIKCAVSLCGPTDFLHLDGYTSERKAEVDALLVRYFGGTLEAMPERYKEASPISHVSKDAPPIFLAHGMSDDVVPFSQAETFYQAAVAAGMSVTYVPVENASHKFDAPDGQVTNPTKAQVIKQMVEFLLKNLIF